MRRDLRGAASAVGGGRTSKNARKKGVRSVRVERSEGEWSVEVGWVGREKGGERRD